MEKQFSINKIDTDEEKRVHTAAALAKNPKATRKIADILNDEIVSNTYTDLKTKILKRLDMNHEQRLRTIIRGISRGEEKPTEYL